MLYDKKIWIFSSFACLFLSPVFLTLQKLMKIFLENGDIFNGNILWTSIKALVSRLFFKKIHFSGDWGDYLTSQVCSAAFLWKEIVLLCFLYLWWYLMSEGKSCIKSKQGFVPQLWETGPIWPFGHQKSEQDFYIVRS